MNKFKFLIFQKIKTLKCLSSSWPKRNTCRHAMQLKTWFPKHRPALRLQNKITINIGVDSSHFHQFLFPYTTSRLHGWASLVVPRSNGGLSMGTAARCHHCSAMHNMANHEPTNYYISIAYEGNIPTVAAIDRDKNSQHAAKWDVHNLNLKDNWIILLHVICTQPYLSPCGC